MNQIPLNLLPVISKAAKPGGGAPKPKAPKPAGAAKPPKDAAAKKLKAIAKPKSNLPGVPSGASKVLAHKGEPCKPGWSVASTGCTPKTKPQPKDKLPKKTDAAATSKKPPKDKPVKPTAAKKPPKQTAADRAHIANFVHKRVGELLGGAEPITTAHITQVKDALMKLTVPEITSVKNKLGVKATGAKADLAKKIAELVLTKKPEPKKPEPPKPPEVKPPEVTEPEKPKDNRKELRDRLSPHKDVVGRVKEVYKIMTEQGKDAGEVQIHGMANADKVKSMNVGGQSVKWTDKTRQAAANTIERMLTNDDMPDHLWKVVKSVNFTDQVNKDDDHWRKQYKNFTASAATGGRGETCIYNGKAGVIHVVSHEAGHSLANYLWGMTTPEKGSAYADAQLHEQPVSEYGKNSPAEDFAEACSLYSEKDKRAELKRQFPRKFKVLEDIFNNDLESQKWVPDQNEEVLDAEIVDDEGNLVT